MKCQTQMGEAYQNGVYAVYPTMLYAGGNACLYNYYLYADIDGYGFSQNINATFQPGYEADQRTGSIDTVNQLTVTVPQNTTFGLYFQWNNFNSSEVAPEGPDADAPKGYRYVTRDEMDALTIPTAMKAAGKVARARLEENSEFGMRNAE